MATIAVIGEEPKVFGYGLAGAIVLPADDPASVLAAWRGLDEDVEVVILTARAAEALAGRRPTWPIAVVMPS